MHLEKEFIGKVLNTGNLSWVQNAGISPEILYDKGEVLDFIKEHYKQYEEVPSTGTVEAETGTSFSDVDLNDLEPKSYYIDKIQERHLENIIGTRIKDVAKGPLDSGDSVQALQELRSAAVEASRWWEGVESEGTGDLTESASIEEIRQDYEDRKGTGFDVGISSPWGVLDEKILGWRDGTLNVIVGSVGVGKSWFLSLSSIEAFHQNQDVLFVSMEMRWKEIAGRLICIEGDVDYGKFMQGDLSPHEMKKFEEATESLMEGDMMRIMDMSRVVDLDDLAFEAAQYDPDIIVLDGIYMLGQSGGSEKSNWERVMDVAAELKRLSIRQDIPVLCTTQFNRDIDEGEYGSLNNLAYARAVGEQADSVLGIYQNEDMENAQQAELYFIKGRHVDPTETETILLNWDMSRMEYGLVQRTDGHSDVVTGSGVEHEDEITEESDEEEEEQEESEEEDEGIEIEGALDELEDSDSVFG